MTTGWWSQPYPAAGAAAGDGVLRILGKPPLPPLVTLVREAAQNSWDAGDPHRTGPVRMKFHLWRVEGARLRLWREAMTPLPQLSYSHGASSHRTTDPAHSVSWDQPVDLLTISDRGTVGLGGPTRADRATDGPNDFVNFLRNVGEPRDVRLGGGTYGFGKAIYYLASKVHTIVVDTSTMDGSTAERRLIGAAIGDRFERRGINYSGRHWWGIDRAEVCEPVRGDDARQLSSALGLPGFRTGELGTDVTVVAPRHSPNDADPDRERTALALASALLWNLWPKMLDRGRGPEMHFEVILDDHPLELPAPSSLPRLSAFVQSYGNLDVPAERETFTRASPPYVRGHFASAVSLAPPVGRGTAIEDETEPFSGPAHHCARMRQAGLVVDYLPGPVAPDRIVQYGAVFRSSAEADSHFAKAEPPTHHEWQTHGLRGTDLGVVRATNTDIRRRLEDLVSPRRVVSEENAQIGMAQLADSLGGLLIGVPGGGSVNGEEASDDGGRGRRGVGGGAKGPRVVGTRTTVRDSRVVIEVSVDVPRREEQRTLQLMASVPGESATEGPPAGGSPPVVEFWTVPGSSTVLSSTPVVSIGPGTRSSLLAVVRPPVPAARSRFAVRWAARGSS